MKTRIIYRQLAGSARFKIAIGLIISLFLAMGMASTFLTINSEFFKIKNGLLLLTTGGVFLLTLAVFVLDIYAKKEIAKESRVTNDINSRINALVYEMLLKFLSSADLQKMIRRHTSNIEHYFKRLEKEVHLEIETTITAGTLREYDRTKNDLKKQEIFMRSILKKLYDARAMEDFIKSEHRNCLDEIREYLVSLIKNNETLKNYYRFQPFGKRPGFNRKEFNLDIDDIENVINITIENQQELSLGRVFFDGSNMRDTSFASMAVLFGLNVEDIADFIHDQLLGSELTEQVLYEFLENIGAAIPFIGPAFIALKICRYLYRFRDRPEELAQLKNNVSASITQYLNTISNNSAQKVNEDSLRYVNELISTVTANFERAKYYTDYAESFF